MPVSKAGPLPHLPTPEHAERVARGYQLLATHGKGGSPGTWQALHLWMQRWTSPPIPYHFIFLTLQACF